MAMDIGSLPSEIGPGDVAVVGDRDDAQRAAIELGVGLLVTSNGTTPTDEVLALARERGTPVVGSPLDSYVTSRMITLSAPCRALMDPEPLTVRPDDLLSDVADEVKEVHYRAAVAVDARRHPIGLVTRTDLLNPRPRRVLLVDHAEQAQSVPGVEQAEIVEILDHHHIGSIETTVPVRATFDPVGSTATLVIERFRQNGMEPSRSTAILLLGAILSDTVILNSPTTTERDHAAVEYLERVLALDARRSAARCSRPPRTSPACRRRGDRLARREGVRGQRRADDHDRPGGDRRRRGWTSAARSCWRRWTTRASGAATRSTR